MIDLGPEWMLLGVATAPLAADAIKHYVRERGWTRRRLVFLTALLVFFGRVKEALARPIRTMRPRRSPSEGGAAGTSGWSAVALTAAIGSAVTIVFFTIPELARGEALLTDRKSTFFGSEQGDRVVVDDGRDLDTSTDDPPPPPPPPPPPQPSSPPPPPSAPPPPPPSTGPEAGLTVIIVGTKGTGTVLIEPNGKVCEPNCNASVPLGDSVTLTPAPDEGSAFVAWKGGDCGDEERCIVVMSKDQRVFAEFGATGP